MKDGKKRLYSEWFSGERVCSCSKLIKAVLRIKENCVFIFLVARRSTYCTRTCKIRLKFLSLFTHIFNSISGVINLNLS